MNEICERVREELALQGRAPDDEAIREHLASCADCASFLQKLTRLQSAIGALEKKDASDALVAKLLARPELRRTRTSRHMPWMAALATAASIAFVMFAGKYLLRARMAPASYSHEDRVQEEFEQGQGSLGAALEKESQDREGLVAPVPEEGAEGRYGYEVKNEAAERPSYVEADKLQRLDQPKKSVGKDDDAFQERARGEIGLLDQNVPSKRVHREPMYPEAATQARVEGTVVLELTLDREGNVSGIRVVQSVPPLDAAAIEAVREWKYAPSESDAPRVFRVPVRFTLDTPDDASLPSLFVERSRVEGLRFQHATGYWANTYLPGDPRLRRLEARLRNASLPPLHRSARPALLEVDPSSNAALSVFVRADRRGLTEKTRLLVQVGLRASDGHARRRPPLNLGVVLYLPDTIDADTARDATALLQSLESARELGDRFRLVVAGPGGGEVLSPETFRHGPLTVALQDVIGNRSRPSLSVTDALALALQNVHAGDDPTMPLGTSVVVLMTGRGLGGERESLERLARESALGGVSTSVIGIGSSRDEGELESLALSGQGRRYGLDKPEEAPGIIDRELTAGSRTVARAVRLSIRLAEGVHLVDVLGSQSLSERETERVRAEERSIDLRLARNLGIEADRGKDEDGIQIVIPAFYAGDAHSILLDVVADGPGAIAEVSARFKDLVQLENTVTSASLALLRSDAPPSPLETSVLDDYLEYRVSEGLRAASDALGRGDAAGASEALLRTRALVSAGTTADLALLDSYLQWLPRLASPDEFSYFRDSLLYASALKFTHRAS
jgi:TonB family protein